MPLTDEELSESIIKTMTNSGYWRIMRFSELENIILIQLREYRWIPRDKLEEVNQRVCTIIRKKFAAKAKKTRNANKRKLAKQKEKEKQGNLFE